MVRAKTGRVTGALVALLTVMKGLPLAYAKDMQEDKEPVFDAAEAWALSLAAIAGMVRDMTPDLARMRELAGSGFATATDLADWLVRVLKLPFRDAHHAVPSSTINLCIRSAHSSYYNSIGSAPGSGSGASGPPC